MSEMLDLMARRRSVPPIALREPGPAPDQLETLLRIASRVPDHGKLVPFRFIVFEGEARHRIGEVIEKVFASDDPRADEGRRALERGRLARAPLVVAVVSRARPHAKIPAWEQELTAGAVCMNLVIAANAMGFATSWLTEWIAFNRRVLDAMGLGASERIAGFIHIGTSAERPADRDRPDLATIVSRYEG